MSKCVDVLALPVAARTHGHQDKISNYSNGNAHHRYSMELCFGFVYGNLLELIPKQDPGGNRVFLYDPKFGWNPVINCHVFCYSERGAL